MMQLVRSGESWEEEVREVGGLASRCLPGLSFHCPGAPPGLSFRCRSFNRPPSHGSPQSSFLLPLAHSINKCLWGAQAGLTWTHPACHPLVAPQVKLQTPCPD